MNGCRFHSILSNLSYNVLLCFGTCNERKLKTWVPNCQSKEILTSKAFTSPTKGDPHAPESQFARCPMKSVPLCALLLHFKLRPLPPCLCPMCKFVSMCSVRSVFAHFYCFPSVSCWLLFCRFQHRKMYSLLWFTGCVLCASTFPICVFGLPY